MLLITVSHRLLQILMMIYICPFDSSPNKFGRKTHFVQLALLKFKYLFQIKLGLKLFGFDNK